MDVNTNHTSTFNEFLQKKYRISVGHGMFYESYVSQGPPHKPTHSCTLQVKSADLGLDHTVVSEYCDTGTCVARDTRHKRYQFVCVHPLVCCSVH